MPDTQPKPWIIGWTTWQSQASTSYPGHPDDPEETHPLHKADGSGGEQRDRDHDAAAETQLSGVSAATESDSAGWANGSGVKFRDFVQIQMKYFYRVAHVVAEVTKFKVPSQYKLFILKPEL